MSSNNPLVILIGKEVNAICFVMDYVEIHFHGPILRCIADPEVSRGGQTLNFPATGSRDAFCALIGATVLGVTEQEDLHIEIRFDEDRTVRVPLTSESRHSGEAVHLVAGPNAPVQVW